MDEDIRPRFEQWARQRFGVFELRLCVSQGRPYYPEHAVESAWQAWLAATEGERARVSACLV